MQPSRLLFTETYVQTAPVANQYGTKETTCGLEPLLCLRCNDSSREFFYHSDQGGAISFRIKYSRLRREHFVYARAPTGR
jgi:hypothetical protein